MFHHAQKIVYCFCAIKVWEAHISSKVWHDYFPEKKNVPCHVLLLRLANVKPLKWICHKFQMHNLRVSSFICSFDQNIVKY